MATLTWSDYRDLRNKAYRAGYGKEELKALSSLPDKAALMSMFQAAENWFVSGFNNTPTSSFKDALSTGLGQTVTAGLAQKVGVVWFDWKEENLL